MRQRLRKAGIACNDQVVGMADSGAMDEAALLAALARLQPGVTEWYLHPAVRDGLTPTMRHYRHQDELAALLSPRVRDAIAARGLLRGSFRTALNT